MFKELIEEIKEFIKDEYKYLINLLLIFIICFYPLDYYIVIGGGIDDIKDRIIVEDGYKSKGSFNISFVSELDGNLFTYGLSYIMPGWERESTSDYKYDDKESLEDIDFRNDLSLKVSASNAIKNAYILANKEVKEVGKHMYVIGRYYDKCNLKVGDEILKIDDQDIYSFDYKEYLNSLDKYSRVKVTVIRNKKEITIETNLISDETTNVMGVYIERYNEYETSPKTEIKYKKSESGPSGGLMTSLSIYDQLVKEDITNGLKIAGTGTMESDGTVGEIGGIEYKVLGADKGKADIFLSPKGDNYKDAIKIVKKHKLKIKVIEVESLEDAINKIKELSN